MKEFPQKSGMIQLDENKLEITQNRFSSSYKVIFLDKIETLELLSLRDMRLLYIAIILIIAQIIYLLVEIPYIGDFLGPMKWGPIAIGILLLIIFYFNQQTSLEIKTANTSIKVEYDEMLLDAILEAKELQNHQHSEQFVNLDI